MNTMRSAECGVRRTARRTWQVMVWVGLVLIGIGCCVQAFGQTAPPGVTNISPSLNEQAQILANLPTIALTNETVGVSQGTLMRNDSTFAAATLVDWSFTKTFFARGEVDEGTAGQGIEGLGLGGGVYKAWSASRGYLVVEGRRDFNPDKWDALEGFGAAWTPSTNGVMANISVGAEERAVENIGSKAGASSETLAVARYSFP